MCTHLLWMGPTLFAHWLVGRASWWQYVPQAIWGEWLCICVPILCICVPILASAGVTGKISAYWALSHLYYCFPHVGACWAGDVGSSAAKCGWSIKQDSIFGTLPWTLGPHGGTVTWCHSCPNSHWDNFISLHFQTLCKLGPSCHQLASDPKITGEMMHLLPGQIWLDTIWEDSEYCGVHG